jgi:hypothetical protein
MSNRWEVRVWVKHKLSKELKPNSQDYIFAGTRNGAPLDLHNLANRVIIPAIEKCVVCRLPKIEHEANGHPFQLDKTIHWEGWHGFRRVLATNLLAIGTPPATIAKILTQRSAYNVGVLRESQRERIARGNG